jgi:hypothetical protein
VSEYAGIEPKTYAMFTLAVRRSDNSARSDLNANGKRLQLGTESNPKKANLLLRFVTHDNISCHMITFALHNNNLNKMNKKTIHKLNFISGLHERSRCNVSRVVK